MTQRPGGREASLRGREPRRKRGQLRADAPGHAPFPGAIKVIIPGNPFLRRHAPTSRKALARQLSVCLKMRSRMIGWRQCADCKKELPDEFYRGESPQCRACAREAELRNPAIKVANGIVAQPREAWAVDLLKRISAHSDRNPTKTSLAISRSAAGSSRFCALAHAAFALFAQTALLALFRLFLGQNLPKTRRNTRF